MEKPLVLELELNKLKTPVSFEKNWIIKTLGLKPLLEKIACLDKLQSFTEKVAGIEDRFEFAKKSIDLLNITLDYDQQDLSKIPKTGPVVVVANHPLGFIDGVSLAYILMQIRPDTKILANFLIQKQFSVPSLCIGVDSFENKSINAQNIAGVREALGWLKDGGVLVIFPAGKMSVWNFKEGKSVDPQWYTTATRLAKRSKAMVMPVYIKGKTSWYFHAAAKISRALRLLLIPQQAFGKKQHHLSIHLGRSISTQELSIYGSLEQQTLYLRNRTYLLKERTDHKALIQTPNKIEYFNTTEISKKLQLEDIQGLPASACLIEQGDFCVYMVRAEQIPHVIQEIGRQREIAFGLAGMTTGKEIDLADLDYHYSHLFILNKKTKQIVGGYRVGLTDHLLPQVGKDGMYVAGLYHLSDNFLHAIEPAIELGRSFIVPEYQKKPQSLMLLWNAILKFVEKNPQYVAIYGVVSISQCYQKLSRDLIVSFLKGQYLDNNMAPLVESKFPYTLSETLPKYLREIIAFKNPTLDSLDTLVREIEPDQKGLPILLKQYKKMHARVLGFNINPNVNDCLECLCFAYIKDMPLNKLNHYMGKEGVESYLRFHAAAPGVAARVD